MASAKRLKDHFGDDKSPDKKSAQYKLGLALQGGGSYGSFMHGVLNALLEADLQIDEITGTSAGSITASLLSYGLNTGGHAEAIRLLDNFWDDVKAEGQKFKTLLNTFNPMAIGMGTYPNMGSVFRYAAAMVPNGFITDRLQQQINNYVSDWEKVGTEDLPVHVNATRVDPKTGERSHVIFSNEDVNADTVIASCSLHELGAKTIDGVQYYDGGYWQNPALEPMENNEELTDMFFITLQAKPDREFEPVHQDSARNTNHDNPGHEIMGSEIFDHIEHLRQQRPDLNIHVISMEVDPSWDETSRVNTDPRWLQEMEEKGYEAGKKWVAEHMHKLGKQSSYEAPATKPARRQIKPK